MLVFLLLINIAAGKWIPSSYVCVIQGFLHLLLRNMHQFLLVAMALDRFLLVFFPFGYPKYHSRGAFLLFCVCWLAAFAMCLPYLPGILDCYSFASFNYYCVIRSACSNACRYVAYFSFIVVAFSSFALPVILYSAMYVKARKMKSTSITAEHDAASTTKANVMMFLVFVTCFLCNTPTQVLSKSLLCLVGVSSFGPVHILYSDYDAYCNIAEQRYEGSFEKIPGI